MVLMGGDGGRVCKQAPKNESADLPSQGDEQLVVVAELNPKDMTPVENLTLSADRTQVTHRVVCREIAPYLTLFVAHAHTNVRAAHAGGEQHGLGQRALDRGHSPGRRGQDLLLRGPCRLGRYHPGRVGHQALPHVRHRRHRRRQVPLITSHPSTMYLSSIIVIIKEKKKEDT